MLHVLVGLLMSTLLLSGCVGGGTATSTADAEKEINKVLQF